MKVTDRSKGSSGKWQIALIGVVFALPMLAAYLWRPTGYVNHGELVEPARPMADVDLRKPDGSVVHLSDLRSKWTLLYVSGAVCDDPCQKNLYKIQQVRLAQSKNMHRVQGVYVGPAGMSGAPGDVMNYQGVMQLQAAGEQLRQLARQLRIDGKTPLDGQRRIFVVDPLGNLMMSYRPDADPSGIRKDLVRLLKVSQVG